MKPLSWLLKAAIFFTLFSFALNNQQDVVLHFFFGTAWRAPLVLVVLVIFSAGVAVGVAGMLPLWWRQRRAAQALAKGADTAHVGPAETAPVIPDAVAAPASRHDPPTPYSGAKPLRELGI